MDDRGSAIVRLLRMVGWIMLTAPAQQTCQSSVGLLIMLGGLVVPDLPHIKKRKVLPQIPRRHNALLGEVCVPDFRAALFLELLVVLVGVFSTC